MSDDETPVPNPSLRQRRWRRGLRWFAAEFLVVVSGVLVALALTSLYEGQRDREREKNYLLQLVADLQETERLMSVADSINVPWDQSLTALVHSFRGGAPVERDSILRWSMDVQFDNPVPVLGTTEALVQTGDVHLIRNLQLRNAVTSYLSTSREYHIPWLLQLENDFVQARNEFRSKVDVLEAESISPSGVLAASEARAHLDVGGTNPFPFNAAGFSSDREAYVLLTRMLLAKRECLFARDMFRREAQKLRERLETALAE